MKYRKLHKYKYQLLKDEYISLSFDTTAYIVTAYITLIGRRLLCEKGYAWDGPSGPTFDTPDSMLGSLAHDALWQLIGMGLLDKKFKKPSDIELGIICIRNTMAKWRANLWVWFLGFISVESRYKPDKVIEIIGGKIMKGE